MAVDQNLAAILKAEASYIGVDTASSFAWSPRGVESKGVSPFAAADAAEQEAGRCSAFLAGPLAKDKVAVPGQRCDLVGKASRVRVASGVLGYGEPVPVFVIGAEERDSDTLLTVLRRL